MRNDRHTYKMGIVGNCSFLAYIDMYAQVRWMCLPKFDSSFIFGSLLDKEKGGEFSIQPAKENYTSRQYYLNNTNILVTEFDNDEGRFRVIDFAPRFYQNDRYYKPLMLIRKIEILEGNPFITVKCKPVGEYGNLIPDVVKGSNHIRFMNLESQVRLTSDIPLNYILDEKAFVLTESKYLVFTFGEPLEASLKSTAESFLVKTQEYWQQWIKATSIPNIFQEQVIRSAMVLKLHQYEDTGGIIASGTTSLPEFDQSERTWDYRYCWMRDTYYTLNSFSNIGHFEELEKYFNYIYNIILNETDRISPLYTISGTKVETEKRLAINGYLGNQPVRIGNDAIKQRQNDVYGQVLVSLLPLFIDKRLQYFDSHKTIQLTTWLLRQIEKTMDEPDSGLWEFGEILQQYTYTMLFNWAGAKAAYKIAVLLNDQILRKKALDIICKASEKIEESYDPGQKAYTQAIGSHYLDASGLQLITMRYLEPDSDRAKDHLIALEKSLKTPDGMFYRYIRDDGLGKPQNSFLICAFWYAEALACVGRVSEAYHMIEKLTGYSNHLGLFSEDADQKGGQWGNFPQTYSHVGLMNAVYRISIKQDKPIFY